jgi:hypothetical protein
MRNASLRRPVADALLVRGVRVGESAGDRLRPDGNGLNAAPIDPPLTRQR